MGSPGHQVFQGNTCTGLGLRGTPQERQQFIIGNNVGVVSMLVADAEVEEM